MSGRFWERAGRFDLILSLAGTAFSVGGSAVVTGLLAKADPVIGKYSPIYWWLLSIFVGLVVSIMLLIIRASVLRQAQAKYHELLCAPRSLVNPLLESFESLIIPVEDLRLPGLLIHRNKHFRKCTFAGPGAIGIIGGAMSNSSFIEIGDIVCVQGAFITGVVVLENCTIEKCEFLRVTILSDLASCKGFKAAGAPVVGAD